MSCRGDYRSSVDFEDKGLDFGMGEVSVKSRTSQGIESITVKIGRLTCRF